MGSLCMSWCKARQSNPSFSAAAAQLSCSLHDKFQACACGFRPLAAAYLACCVNNAVLISCLQLGQAADAGGKAPHLQRALRLNGCSHGRQSRQARRGFLHFTADFEDLINVNLASGHMLPYKGLRAALRGPPLEPARRPLSGIAAPQACRAVHTFCQIQALGCSNSPAALICSGSAHDTHDMQLTILSVTEIMNRGCACCQTRSGSMIAPRPQADVVAGPAGPAL